MAPRRLVTLLALLLLASAPLAAADQDIAVGPARVETRNATYGDGSCEPGAAGSGGSQSRDAWVGVDVTEHESVGVLVLQSCSAYAWNDGFSDNSEQWNMGSVQVGRFSDGNPGPVVMFQYVDHRYDYGGSEGHHCGSQVYASGPALVLGCFPDGGQWPMLPALP